MFNFFGINSSNLLFQFEVLSTLPNDIIFFTGIKNEYLLIFINFLLRKCVILKSEMLNNVYIFL